MKMLMLRLVLVGAVAAISGGAPAQSPYPNRSFAETFGCRETALAQFAGAAPTADIARQLLTSSGAKKLRWLQPNRKPGSGKKGRITAQLDGQGRIATAFCG